MRALNFRHLRYFWAVAKAGVRASEQLHLTPQSISRQLRLLEEALGKRLMRRRGRVIPDRPMPTELGLKVFSSFLASAA